MKSELIIKLICANYVLTSLQIPREAKKIDILKLYILCWTNSFLQDRTPFPYYYVTSGQLLKCLVLILLFF